jgi:hypothetical protein
VKIIKEKTAKFWKALLANNGEDKHLRNEEVLHTDNE